MRDLDTKDREILEILSREARIALKALAARIGLSRSATSERVINLERNGVIRGYRADIGEIDANVIRAILLVSLKRTGNKPAGPACPELPGTTRLLGQWPA
jgi:DNA-binding Lrp family transcriptional regulator